MRHPTVILLLTLAAFQPSIASALTPADQADEDTNIGITKCSSYVIASIGLPTNTHLHTHVGNYQFYDYSLRVLDWMTGYIISYKRHTKSPIGMIHTDYGSIETFLRSYCKQSPDEDFEAAADAYLQQQLDNTL